MNRVVVTGLGAVSCIGNNVEAVLSSLRHGRSGIVFVPEMQELGFKCCLHGPVRDLDTRSIPKKQRLTMSPVAQYAMVAAQEALYDAGLSSEQIRTDRAGVVVGTEPAGVGEVYRIEQLLSEHKNPSRVGGTGIVKMMNSTAACNLASALGVQGRVCSISSACCSGLDDVGHAYELIKYGVQDVVICGASEEDCWKQIAIYYDSVKLMPTSWNDSPHRACRPYDRDREGIVVSSGAGILVLESLAHARRRGARIYAEIAGYGVTNDGDNMWILTGDGLARAIQISLIDLEQGHRQVDYINTHGTGTKVGDEVEAGVVRDLFGSAPLISSTKSIAGHSMAATGALEAVYTVLMLHHNFVCPTVNLEHVADECRGIRHVREPQEHLLTTAMTFNAGLGGTNASMVFTKCEE